MKLIWKKPNRMNKPWRTRRNRDVVIVKENTSHAWLIIQLDTNFSVWSCAPFPSQHRLYKLLNLRYFNSQRRPNRTKLDIRSFSNCLRHSGLYHRACFFHFNLILAYSDAKYNSIDDTLILAKAKYSRVFVVLVPTVIMLSYGSYDAYCTHKRSFYCVVSRRSYNYVTYLNILNSNKIAYRVNN